MITIVIITRNLDEAMQRMLDLQGFDQKWMDQVQACRLNGEDSHMWKSHPD